LPFFVGTDVGGTFTDLWVAADDGRARVFKAPTTKDVIGGVIDAINLAAESYQLSFEAFCSNIARFGHGTTVGLNALLTGTAAKTYVLTTKGFGDTLEIGRLRRQTSGMNELEMTDAFLRNRYPPLVPRSRIVEIDERIDATGRIVAPLDEEQARRSLKTLSRENPESIAICTLFSVANPVHELKLRDLVQKELPDVFVSLSHEISPGVGEYARMSTTAANASLGPIAGRYLARLQEILRKAGMRVPILMMTCSGGVLPTEFLSDRPIYALFSGPAAGVMGSQAIGDLIGSGNILTTDIGGTSFDVGVIVDRQPVTRAEISVAGADMKVRSIDVDSIGAGGGSIASVHLGELRVGPRSAGANPGPACYLRGGTEPTSTDADLILGVLDPQNFLGGRMTLDVEAAERAIHDKIAKPLGMTAVEAAWGIRKVLDSRMADLLRRMTLERGYNPLDFVLLANGGAGPSHAWVLSAELGLNGFVVPAAATAQSAFGTANCDLGFVAERAVYVRVPSRSQPTPERLQAVNEAMLSASNEIKALLRSAASSEDVKVELRVSVRFRGQTNYLDVPFAGREFDLAAYDRVVTAFQQQYEILFGGGAGFSQAGFEILSVQAAGAVRLTPPSINGAGDQLQRTASRKVVFDDPANPVETAVYQTLFPPPGTEVEGPCIIEFPGQSVVVAPGARASADQFGNLHVTQARP
jgi:N-methylhydantoinase A